MTGKELSEAIAEAAARTERAAAMQQEAIARQQAAIARQEAATGKLEELEARRGAEGDWMRQATERQEQMLQRQDKMFQRQEKMFQDQVRRTDEIVAELRDQRDERRALIEALLRMTDRLPPPPPRLKSA